MAAKRVTKTAIDWAKFSSLISDTERPMFNAFKAKSDGYLRRVMSYPETAPTIDWAYYRTSVAEPSLVDALEKSYKSLSIPYPNDTLSNKVDEQEKNNEKGVEEFCQLSNRKIEDALSLKKKFEIMIPYDQMTEEDFVLTFPDWSWRWQDPSIWPHYEKTPGLSKEERWEFAKPDGRPYSIS